MQGGDMDLIKDIPGYKVILKAVLKGQIQYLVEQLADHTGEESVLLTASVSEGSLSHLGSESGKGFLQDHDDIKSQFLGFCMKKYHKQHQSEPEEFIASDHTPQFGTRHFPGPKPRFKSTPSQMGPRGSQFTSPALNPRSATGSTPKVMLGKGLRHKPYISNGTVKPVLIKPNKKTKTKSETKSIAEIKINTNEVVKIEAVDQDDESQSDARSEHSEASNDSELRSMDASQIQAAMVSLPLHNFIPATSVTESVQAASDREESVENSRSSLSNVGDTQHLDNTDRTNFGEDSDRSEIGGGSADELNVNISMNDNDFNVHENEAIDESDKPNVKVEATSDSEMDLEITGVEPGTMTQGHGDIPGANNRLGLGASTSGVQKRDIKGFKSRDNDPDYADDDDDSPLSLAVYTDYDDADSSGSHATTTPRNKTCTVCGKWFASGSSLSMHMRIHTGEKPYRCETCGRQFNQKGNLKTHRLSHMEKPARTHGTQTFLYVDTDGVEKVFVGGKPRRKRIRKPSRRTKPCPICDKSFPSGSSLEIHIRTHTGEKPFSCDVCGKPFAQKGNLIKHQGSHYKTPFGL